MIEAMLRPEFYPDRPAGIRLIQTHISYVVLAGSVVYKVKKPVRFSFLDFSTLALRRHFCHEEVRLNRRLAPHVYQCVVSLCLPASGYRLGAEDDPAAVEYAVRMHRLPEEHTLDRLLTVGRATPDMIDTIAARLVEFHRQAPCDADVTADGAPAAVGAILEDNFNGVRPFRGHTISAADDLAIHAFLRGFLAHHHPWFYQRQTAHRIRDGHGDLHADHVYMTDPPVMVDCIEFNPAFRHCDVASDLAFLAMDIEYHGCPELAERLVSRYAALSGDAGLRRLMPFYKCYRAYVRGKVDSLKSAEEEVGAVERAQARVGARRHFALAYRYTWVDQPGLVVMAGLSGTGKSTIAAALHERTGFTVISSDVVRKQLVGLPPTARLDAAYDIGLYAPEMSARTYRALLERAGEVLAAGRGVILDATFQLRAGREEAARLAAAHGVPSLLVECRCEDGEIRRRIARRGRAGTDASDADWNVYLEQCRRCEPFDEPDRLTLDTTAPTAELTTAIEQALRARRPGGPAPNHLARR